MTRRPLRPVDRWVRVPLGLLWLVVLAIVAVPVTIYMTLLYYMTQAAVATGRALRPRRTARERERG